MARGPSLTLPSGELNLGAHTAISKLRQTKSFVFSLNQFLTFGFRIFTFFKNFIITIHGKCL